MFFRFVVVLCCIYSVVSFKASMKLGNDDIYVLHYRCAILIEWWCRHGLKMHFYGLVDSYTHVMMVVGNIDALETSNDV